MTDLKIDFKLEKLYAGWIDFVFRYGEFELTESLSLVLNNPVEEICDLILKPDLVNKRKVTFWLEPHTFRFYFSKSEHLFNIEIFEADDFYRSKETHVLSISGSFNKIVRPLAMAVFVFMKFGGGKGTDLLEDSKLNSLADKLFEGYDKTQMAVGIFDQWADLYQQKYMDVEHYSDTLNTFCENVTKHHANLLELACGPGNVTKYILQRRPDFKILATDLAPNMVELAKKNNPSVETLILDCRQISALEQTFDGIMCAFCMPYISREDALKLINDAVNLLNEEGVLYISTMEDDYGKSGYQSSSKGDIMYMYFHEGRYLVNALEKRGMQILEIKRQAFPPVGEPTATDLVIISKKIS